MKIKEKLMLGYDGLVKNGAINIVAFGDSVTHGALAGDEINYETVYWNRLRKMLNEVRNYVPVNAINAGIGGITASGSLDRIERDVLSHHPDLVIVCFGLNDVNGTLEEYLGSLEIIFRKCLAAGTEIIFLTPNMLNTYVAKDTEERFADYAAVTAEYQNSGRFDSYIEAAIALAEKMNVPVCDCYAKWKKLSETEDTTMLLCNRINHPCAEMHELFAKELFNVIMG